jgi:restriction system protein
VRRRRHKEHTGLFEVLANAPWQVSLAFAVVVYGLAGWIIPIFFISPLLTPLGKTISALAPFAWVLLIPGIISYGREVSARANTRTDFSIAFHQASNAAPSPLTTTWSVQLLRNLEWKRFEMICAEYFRLLGKKVETIAHGSDGGVDARIYSADNGRLEYAIQCKAWANLVGVKPVRELFGVMAHEAAGKGIFMTTDGFTKEAVRFAEEHSDKLFLVDGSKFLSMILKLPAAKQEQLLAYAVAGDYRTPTCPSCGIKLVRRAGRSGAFWGCRNFPRCRTVLKVA